MYKETIGPGLTSLPSAEGKIFKRQVWNLYREFRKTAHYYHLHKLNRRDILVKAHIDAGDGMDLVNKYNESAKNAKAKKNKVARIRSKY